MLLSNYLSQHVAGVGRLLFEMVRGVQQQFHSSTEQVLQINAPFPSQNFNILTFPQITLTVTVSSLVFPRFYLCCCPDWGQRSCLTTVSARHWKSRGSPWLVTLVHGTLAPSGSRFW